MKKSYLIILLMLFRVVSVSQQQPIVLETDGITSPLHNEGLGKVYFTVRNINTNELQQSDFLTTYTLTNKSDLYFVAYFDNSLTNYLARLDPESSPDSLVAHGNFQFSLLVDGKPIYSSNLLPGAPAARQQHHATLLNKPFINNKDGNGLWSESFWNRFLLNGGDAALTDGPHQLQFEIRPYLNKGGVRTGALMAKGELNLLVERNPKINTDSFVLHPPLPYPGFNVSTEAFDTSLIKVLKGQINEGVFKKIGSVVVIKNGELLIEEYFNGEDRFTLRDTRSVGKSISSALMGIALEKKYIKSVHEPLKSFYDVSKYAHYERRKGLVTVEDLLTMSSVFDGNDEDAGSLGNEENMYPTENWVRFALDLPVRATKGVIKWKYFTAGVVLLGDILDARTPGGLQRFAHESLFQPLGITNYIWQFTPQHIPNTAGGLKMNALDWAKFGQLYKNGGSWQGKRILTKQWVEHSFTKHRRIESRENEYYGYLFWNKSFLVNGVSYEAFYAAGNGGNYVLVFKDQPLVVVVTATAYGQLYAHTQVDRMLRKYILPAVVSPTVKR